MNNKNTRYEENLEKIKDLRPIDDEFMRAMFKDNVPLAETVLRKILDKPDLVVEKLETQRDLKRLAGSRTICLDAFCIDSEGKEYDIEIQRSDKGADPHRARYHLSALDVDNLKAGRDFKELPETYVIFITENDYIGDGEDVYVFDRINTKTQEPLNDGTHIIYVNGAVEGMNDLAKLMHDFRCSNPDEMYFKEMADAARYYKENPKGVSEMSKIFDELREESRQEGIKEGIKEGIIEMILKLLVSDSLTIQQISEISGLSVEEIEKLKLNLAN